MIPAKRAKELSRLHVNNTVDNSFFEDCRSKLQNQIMRKANEGWQFAKLTFNLPSYTKDALEEFEARFESELSDYRIKWYYNDDIGDVRFRIGIEVSWDEA